MAFAGAGAPFVCEVAGELRSGAVESVAVAAGATGVAGATDPVVTGVVPVTWSRWRLPIV